MKTPRLLFLPVAMMIAASGQSQAADNTITVPVRDKYAKVDVERTMRALHVLGGDNKAERKKLMDEIQKNSAHYAPPAFFALAAALWQDGRSDDAVFWFNAGRLRGRFDAARCADVSARQGIDVMVMQMPPGLLQGQFKDLDKLEATIRKVVAWDEATPYKYDHRWINLHGMDAYMSALDPTRQGSPREMSLPEKEWPSLAKQARENLRSNSRGAINLHKQKQSETADEPQ